jgi:predicted MPP superfamily phosphohydrolase
MNLNPIIRTWKWLALIVAGMPIIAWTASADPAPLFRFALISDTHLGAHGQQDELAFSNAVREINATDAAFTLCLGDLVNAGNPLQYPAWKKIAAGLSKPWYAVPGNHDPVPLFTSQVQAETDFAFDRPPFRFIGFNSANTNSHTGYVTPAQLAWLDIQLAAAEKADLRAILFTHVPRHKNLHPDRGWWIKDADGGQGLRELLHKHRPAVAALFAGHMHCGLRGWQDLDSIPEILVPALGGIGNARRKWDPAAMEGWVLEEFRNGYLLADVFPDAIRFTYKPLGVPSSVTTNISLRLPQTP